MNGTIINQSQITGIINNNYELKGTIRDNELKGSISGENKLIGEIRAGLSVVGTLNQSNQLIAILETSSISYPNYDGEYIITPRVEEQILETKNKITRENIEIKEIPYHETSNEYGYTITIA